MLKGEIRSNTTLDFNSIYQIYRIYKFLSFIKIMMYICSHKYIKETKELSFLFFR